MRFIYRVLSLKIVIGWCLVVGVAVAAEVEISYEKFQLDNGLTVIVHEDHKAPIVAVNVWYHVGSKDERPGKTGFAHLFEHLMFNGSEHYNDEFFNPFRKVGATDMNGTTNQDRTNYFENVPSTALDMALWMESDRMGHLLGVIDQARLDEQRGVVQNEKRQGENQPYGKAFSLLEENAYSAGHPYSWSPIGSMEDLNAASLADVHAWFEQYYGPNNAVLVLAGDVTVAQARPLVQKYFGHIPAGPPLVKRTAWVDKRVGEKRLVAYDRVPQERIYLQWNIPQIGHADGEALDLLARILGGGKNSRLYKRLVYRDQVATEVFAETWGQEMSGSFLIVADAKPGVVLAVVEKAVMEELAVLLRQGPDAAELARARTSIQADFLRGAERIGGFGGKSDILARGEIFESDPAAYQSSLQRLQQATVAQLQRVAERWLSDGRLVLEYRPYPQFSNEHRDVERKSGPPEVVQMPDLSFPAVQRATLSNGLKVMLAARHEVPVVKLRLVVDAGYAADQGVKLGTSGVAMQLLDAGAGKLDALQISAKLEDLGALVSAGSTLDTSSVSLDALKQNLDASLDLFAKICLQPMFPQSEIDRMKPRLLAQIQQEKAEPMDAALRLLPPLIYGAQHAYAIPFTGSGTEASVQSLLREDLQQFHKVWFRPDNAVMIVTGDTTLAEIVPRLEKTFGRWQAPATTVPQKNIATAALPAKQRVFLLDRPGAEQSVVIAAQLAPSEHVPERMAIERMNDVIGGNFTSRLNMNLREKKHWSYGARTLLQSTKGQSPYLAYAGVQTDKTRESVQEIVQEFVAYVGARPAQAAEVQLSIENGIRSMPGKFETSAAVLGILSKMAVFGYPDNYVIAYQDRLKSVTLDEVHKAARSVLKPAQFTWVIVGDLARIEQGIRELNLGEVYVIDADGNTLSR